MKKQSCFLLLRRVAAFLYDCLLLVAVFFVVTAVAVWQNDMEVVSGVAFYLLLLVIAAIFFVGFWKNGGQTLGMRAWRIKLVNANGQPVTWPQSLMHFMAGFVLFGVTYISILFSSNGDALHDKLAKTRIERDFSK